MVMTYITLVELYCLMFYAKFQNHRPSGSGEEDSLRVLLFIVKASIF